VTALTLLLVTAAASGTTFEEVAMKAAPVSDLGMLVSPFLDDCKRRREIDRERCAGVRSFLRKSLPGRTFLVSKDGAEAVAVSGYDGKAHGFHVSVLGCLACKQPVEAGPDRERRFVTLKTPGKGAAPGKSELGGGTVTFTSVAESEKWSKSVQPHLRAELVFQPADEPWGAGGSRGYTFKPLAYRVYDACTGEVVVSQPPSQGPAQKAASCTAEVGGVAQGQSTTAPGAPLEPGAINSTLAEARPELEACTKRFPMPGTAQLAFAVASSGVVQSVVVEGAAAGTALAECLSDAASRVKFPPFKGEVQRFKYPLKLK
jgi:hypothetical protein